VTGIQMTPVEFDVCWEALGLGESPIAFELPSPGRTGAERAAVRSEAFGALRRRGLADAGRSPYPSSSTPAPAVAGVLRLLATADHTVDVRHLDAGRTVVGLGAVRGPDGVVVLHRGPRLELARMDGARVVPALVGIVAPEPAGVGRPVTLPVAVLDAALAGRPRTGSAFADELVRQGVASVDAAAAAHMSRGVLARGQFGVTGRRPGLTGPPGSVPPGATGRRGPWVIGYHRAANGWFVQLRRAGAVTLAPLDTARLRARVAELIGVVRADQSERSARISSA
jgi:hypothetical protein